jgi:hypothetical protein
MKSSDELANEMARKCAEQLNEGIDPDGALAEEDKYIMLCKIPLTKLIAVARAAELVSNSLKDFLSAPEIQELHDAVQSLRTEIPEL